MTLTQRINELTIEECAQIVEEYEVLQNTGVLGDTLLRTITRELYTMDVFNFTMVACAVFHRMAIEYRAVIITTKQGE